MTFPAIVVTGVSTGIGRAVAEAAAARGFLVFGSVRSPSDARAFEAVLGESGRALVFDVSDEPAIRAAAATVEESVAGAGLFGLVNNAGIAVAGPLAHLPLDRLRWQLEVNLTGVLAVTQAFLPLLRRAGASGRRGRIVNISSAAGSLPMPFAGPYAASKAALDALSESLRRELLIEGVDVCQVVPAAARTPIWDKGHAESLSPYAGTPYAGVLPAFREIAFAAGQAGVSAARVADAVLLALTARRPPARKIVSATPVSSALMRLLPRRLLDRLIARRLRFPPPP